MRLSTEFTQSANNDLRSRLLQAGKTVLAVFFTTWLLNQLYRDSPALLGLNKLLLGLIFLAIGIPLFGSRRMGVGLGRLSAWWIGLLFAGLAWFLVFAGRDAAQINFADVGPVDLLFFFSTGFWEEAFYHGLLFAGFASLIDFLLRRIGNGRISLPLARWIQALVMLLLVGITTWFFVISHSNQGGDAFVRAALGLLLGLVVLYTETIWLAVILHAGYDVLATAVTGDYVIEPMLYRGVILAICITGIAIVLIRRRNFYLLPGSASANASATG